MQVMTTQLYAPQCSLFGTSVRSARAPTLIRKFVHVAPLAALTGVFQAARIAEASLSGASMSVGDNGTRAYFEEWMLSAEEADDESSVLVSVAYLSGLPGTDYTYRQ